MGVKYLNNGSFRIDATGTTAAFSLAGAATPPAGATGAIIGADGADLRWTGANGSTPVAGSNASSRGNILKDQDTMVLSGENFTHFKMIRQGSGLFVDVQYFKN